jgi:hypothetical protein
MGHSRQTGQIRQNGRSGGFALRELAAVSAVVAVGLSAVMVGAGQSRKSAGLAGSLANLKKIGEAGGNYLADFDDQLWSFTWSMDEHPTDYNDLRNPQSNATALMFQTVDIIRRLTGDDDIPRLDDRCRPIFTSTLVLADYLGDELPAEWMVSPGDSIRLEWLRHPDDPPDFNEQGGAAWEIIFGFYGSSYGLMPAFFAPNEKVGNQMTVYQYKPNHDLLYYPFGVGFGGQRGADLLSPAHKVQVAERESFYHGVRSVYHLHPSARVPLLMADGSAGPRTTADANTSFKPNLPDDQSRVTTLDYVPHSAYEAPPVGGGARDSDLESYYKWTRRGLRGIDFAGERAE